MKIIKNILGFLWSVLQVVIIVYVVFVTCCILMRNKYGFTQFDKYVLVHMREENVEYVKDSKEGNLLVVKNAGKINVGDVIYYYAPINEEYVVCSGVVETMTEGDSTSLYYLNDKDNTTVPSTRLLGKYANQYENFGGILDLLESRFGFLLLVLLPIMIVFIYQIYEFVIVIKSEKELEDETKKQKEIKTKSTTKPVIKSDDDEDVEVL